MKDFAIRCASSRGVRRTQRSRSRTANIWPSWRMAEMTQEAPPSCMSTSLRCCLAAPLPVYPR
eukprot:13017424-Alexandrium_andersonii.AAC.1